MAGAQRHITSRDFLNDCPEEISSIYRYWERARGERRMPRRTDIDPAGFKSHLPGILLVDIEGTDARGIGIFRYRVVGTGEVTLRGHDPTGKLVREGFFGPSLEDVIGTYEMVRRDRSFLYDPLEYVAPNGRWCCECTIFLPLSEDGDTVSQILVYSVARERRP